MNRPDEDALLKRVRLNTEAPDDLLDRILASRATGKRVVLPEGAPRRASRIPRPVRIAILGAAAVLIALAVPTGQPSGEDCMRKGIGRLFPVTIFGVALACAETPTAIPDSAFHPVVALNDRLVPGVYEYRTSMWTDGLVESPNREMTMTLQPTDWRGEAAWQAISRTVVRFGRESLDTTIVARGTMVPRYNSSDGRVLSLVVGDSVRRTDGARWTDGRTRFVDMWFASGRTIFPLSASHRFLMFASLPLTDGWLGELEGAHYVVLGRETITVPAGTFETWRVERRGGGAEREAWNQWRGWLAIDAPIVVKWETGTFEDRYETQLVSFKPSDK